MTSRRAIDLALPSVTTHPVLKRATISACGKYRYRLTRRWGHGTSLPFVMLNPSAADAEIDDPTIRRCMFFARREGMGGIVVANLFAFRATNPEEMMHAINPAGPDNHDTLSRIAFNAAGDRVPIVCAWGAHWMATDTANFTVSLFNRLGAELRCLGMTKAGAPRHPLYVRGDQPLEMFP